MYNTEEFAVLLRSFGDCLKATTLREKGEGERGEERE